MKFCLGDSLGGIGIGAGSVLAVLKINGAELGRSVDEWLANHQITKRSMIEAGSYKVDLAKDTLTLPNGIIVEKGHILSMQMADEVRKQYVTEFEKRNFFASDESKSLTVEYDELLDKVRIFGGFTIEERNGTKAICIVCYRYPSGATAAEIGSATHRIDRLSGFVVDYFAFEDTVALSGIQLDKAA